MTACGSSPGSRPSGPLRRAHLRHEHDQVPKLLALLAGTQFEDVQQGLVVAVLGGVAPADAWRCDGEDVLRQGEAGSGLHGAHRSFLARVRRGAAWVWMEGSGLEIPQHRGGGHAMLTLLRRTQSAVPSRQLLMCDRLRELLQDDITCRRNSSL